MIDIFFSRLGFTDISFIYSQSDALTVQRARLVEVEYALRVSLSVGSLTGTSEAVHVVLPIRIVNFISLDPPPSEPLIVATSSSVIALDTPRTDVRDSQSFSLEPSTTRSMLKGQPMVASLSKSFSDNTRRTRHNDAKSYMNESSKRARQRPNAYCEKPLPIPTPSVASSLHDLGSVESADDLDCLLGDIPGSASILEESDIAATSTFYDSGYGEETGSDSDGDGNQDFTSDGCGYEEEEDSEDVGSDEELERMVECASTTLESSASCAVPLNRAYTTGQGILLHASDPASRSDRQNTLIMPAPSPHNIPSEAAEDARHERRGRQSCRREYRDEREISCASNDDSAIPATSSMVKISKQSLAVHETSSSSQSTVTNGEVNSSNTYPSQAAPPVSLGQRTNRTIPRYGPRPSARRSLTAPRPQPRSFTCSSPVRQNAVAVEQPHLISSVSVAQGVGSTAGRLDLSGVSAGAGAGTNNVRARIAMLEQRSKEECLANDGQGFGQTFGGRPRSMTTS